VAILGQISFKTDPVSIDFSKSQAVTGVVFFDFGSFQFPEKGWNDFIVVVLSWWLIALKRIDRIGRSMGW